MEGNPPPDDAQDNETMKEVLQEVEVAETQEPEEDCTEEAQDEEPSDTAKRKRIPITWNGEKKVGSDTPCSLHCCWSLERR